MSVVAHTHESESEGGLLYRPAFRSSVGDFAGTITAHTRVEFILQSYALFPMIQSTFSTAPCQMDGHSTDGASADSPRFSLWADPSNVSYDIHYRFLSSGGS